jgi:hypothetical protein
MPGKIQYRRYTIANTLLLEWIFLCLSYKNFHLVHLGHQAGLGHVPLDVGELAEHPLVVHLNKSKLFPAVFWIRIRIQFVSWIRIRIPNADPDPAADKISSKSQKNSYHLELTNFKFFLSYLFKF